MTSFQTPTSFSFFRQINNFCSHIAECADIAEFANIAEFSGKKLAAIMSPTMYCFNFSYCIFLYLLKGIGNATLRELSQQLPKSVFIFTGRNASQLQEICSLYFQLKIA